MSNEKEEEIISLNSQKDKQRWKYIDDKNNYKKAILQSIIDYGYKGQLDIVQTLFGKLNDLKWENDRYFIDNILLRIIQYYIETIEAYVLLQVTILQEIKVGTEFYKLYLQKPRKQGLNDNIEYLMDLAEDEVLQLYGVESLVGDDFNTKRLIEEHRQLYENLYRKFSNNKKKDGKENSRTADIDILRHNKSFKHGFRVLTFNKYTKKFISIEDNQLIGFVLPDEREQLHFRVGGTNKTKTMSIQFSSISNNPDELTTKEFAESLKGQIVFFSEKIRNFAQLHLCRLEDSYSIVPMLVNWGYVKIDRNQKCPCGSGKKYKKCHGRMSGSNNC